MHCNTFCSLILLSTAGLTASAPTQAIVSSCAKNSFQVVPNNGSGIWPYRTYISSNATPPQLNITATGQNLQPGLIFVGQGNSGRKSAVAQQAAFILTDQGDLVYNLDGISSNFHAQTFRNQSVITLWDGSGGAADVSQVGHGYGFVRILDSGYSELSTVCPKLNITSRSQSSDAECVADPHESYITEDNTMPLTVYNVTQADLSDVGGPQNGWVTTSLAVEVDISTNETLFVWDPMEHVSLALSHLPIGDTGHNSSDPYDFFHMNSIQSYKGGFLINSRHFWTTYFVNRNGDIEWQVNGEDGGDFGSLPEGAHFAWEHDARIETDPNDEGRSLLRWFANDNYMPGQANTSIGLSLSFSYPPSRSSNVTLDASLSDPAQPLAVFAEGAHNILANGNHFIGYGFLPFIKEFGPAGEVLWSAQFGFQGTPNSAQSYRVFKQDWHATPTLTKPSLVILSVKNVTDHLFPSCAQTSNHRGFVSWNGATDVTSYNVYTGDSVDDLSLSFTVPKMGFETEFVIPAGAAYVQIGAVEGTQDEVSRSAVLSPV